jgi:hypothetical protein
MFSSVGAELLVESLAGHVSSRSMPFDRCVAAALGLVLLAAGCGAGGGGSSSGGAGKSGAAGHGGATGEAGAGPSTGGSPGSGGSASGGATGTGGVTGTGGANATGGGTAGSGGAGGRSATGGVGGAKGGAGGVGGAFQAASHPTLPQVVNLGGPILVAPKVLPILYASDSGSADVKAFLKEYAASAAWTEQTSEYGVGALTVLPPVTLNGTAPGTIAEATLQSMLASNTSGANPSWGPLDPNTIYLFVMPEGTIETTDSGSCCTEFDGYHVEAQLGSKVVPFAVGCACPNEATARYTTLQERTVAISHELVEAVTDPFPNLEPAYEQEDDDNIAWTLVTGGEVADMCEFNDDANLLAKGAKYTIQRTWSNAAAARGANPCVPVATSTPYLNAFPALTRVSTKLAGQSVSTLGLSIPIGQKKTVPLTLSSAGPTALTWTVQVFDYDEAVVGTTAGLGLSLDKMSGRNGDTLQLAITPKRADPQIGGEAFLIISTYGNPGDPDYETQLVMGLVTN